MFVRLDIRTKYEIFQKSRTFAVATSARQIRWFGGYSYQIFPFSHQDISTCLQVIVLYST